jgi:hypothetical protein
MDTLAMKTTTRQISTALAALFFWCFWVPQVKADPADSSRNSFRPVIYVGGGASSFDGSIWFQSGVANRHHTWLAGISYRPFYKQERFVYGAVYQYFPNPPGRRFDIFFQLETELGWYETDFLKALYGGYGLSVRLGKKAWLRTNYGLGLIHGVSESMFFGASSLDIAGNIRLGFGFRF